MIAFVVNVTPPTAWRDSEMEGWASVLEEPRHALVQLPEAN